MYRHLSIAEIFSTSLNFWYVYPKTAFCMTPGRPGTSTLLYRHIYHSHAIVVYFNICHNLYLRFYYLFQIQHLSDMNFLRNRLVILGFVLLATILLYLLLPSIRQGSMEPSLDVQKMGLVAGSPPPPPTVNMSIRTGQLPGDPPLFFREALPVDTSGRQILPR